MVLFGQVDKVEVASKGSGDSLSSRQRPRSDELLGLPLVAAFVPSADDGPSQELDVSQKLGAARVGDDLAEQLAEHPHIPPQRLRDLPSGNLPLPQGGGGGARPWGPPRLGRGAGRTGAGRPLPPSGGRSSLPALRARRGEGR